MSARSDEEAVLVIPRSAVMADPGWHGVRLDGAAELETIVGSVGRYLPRSVAERDRAWKQVIPYLVLRDGERYFLMRRTRAGADRRLHDRWSIGVGGHLNPGDAGLRDGLLREWSEEIDAAFIPDFELVGLLNDDTTDVGSVHLGAVYLADARGRAVAIRETAKLSGAFSSPADVSAVEAALETWSALVFRFLESGGGGAEV